MDWFYKPDTRPRTPERKRRSGCGIAEANMAVAAGLRWRADPLIGPRRLRHRAQDQLRTTIGYNHLPVKIADARQGSVGGRRHPPGIEEIF